ncbi:MAG TPA: TrmH family RNA methyltransferase [Anaeromyxobacteraceae bacterium]|nr:TrmH family RNA methyltransferase [Anaeromyxobacteraceae bacterium]
MGLGKVRFVLHRPQSAENVGAAARAMKNFALERLLLVAPPSWEGLPRGGEGGTAREDFLARARRVARRAADLLDRAEIHGDLRGALAGTTWACGTTSRAVEGRPRIDPRELAAEVARRAEVAVVFGEERRGLSDAELELCQAVCTIPTREGYDSMNLAQAVAVVAYEIGGGPPGGAVPDAGPARHETVEALWERLRTLLSRAGYLNPQNPDHVLAEWRRLLARAEPSQREVELLVAAVRSLERLLGETARR